MLNIPYLQKHSSKGRDYYRYRLPDGRYERLGRDLDAAVARAKELNEALGRNKLAHPRTVSEIISEFPVSMDDAQMDRLAELIAEKVVTKLAVR